MVAHGVSRFSHYLLAKVRNSFQPLCRLNNKGVENQQECCLIELMVPCGKKISESVRLVF